MMISRRNCLRRFFLFHCFLCSCLHQRSSFHL